MTTGRNNEKAMAVWDKHVQHGVEAVRSYLLSEIYKIEDKVTASMKKTDMRNGFINEFKGLVAEHRSAVSNVKKKIDYSDSDAVSHFIFSDVEYYAMMARTYVGMTDVFAERESRSAEVSKTFERMVQDIDYGSFGYLNKTISALDQHGVPNLAEVKTWFEERQADRFGFKAANDIFLKALSDVKYGSSNDDLWASKIGVLGDTMIDIMCNSVTRFLTCVSAFANTNVAQYSVAANPAERYKETMVDIDMLMELHAETAAMSLLRKAPSDGARQNVHADKSQEIFMQRMLYGINAFRKFMSDQIRSKEEEFFSEMEGTGAQKELIDVLREKAKRSHPAEEDARVGEAISIALSNPKERATLDAVLKEVITINSMRYAALLASSANPNDNLKSGVHRAKVLREMDEIRSIVLEMTMGNTRSAIETLDGKGEKGELSEISDWFVRRSAKRFEFGSRKEVLDSLLAIGEVTGWLKVTSNEIGNSLFAYVLSLEAISNAAAGLEGAAVKNLIALRKLDSESMDFYSRYKGIGSAPFN